LSKYNYIFKSILKYIYIKHIMSIDKSVFNKNNKFAFGKRNKSNKMFKFEKKSGNKLIKSENELLKSENELLKSENELLKTKLKRLEKRNIREVIKYNNNTIKANTDNIRVASGLLQDVIEWEQQFNNLRTIIGSIKRLSNHDTIKELCNNIEYISLPKTRIPITDNFDVNDVINDDTEYDYVNSETFINELEVYEVVDGDEYDGEDDGGDGEGGGEDDGGDGEDGEDGEDGGGESQDVMRSRGGSPLYSVSSLWIHMSSQQIHDLIRD
jgi:hypothetical protein